MQESQRFHLVSVEVVQDPFQKMDCKKQTSTSSNVPQESTEPGYSHAKSPHVGRIRAFLPLMDIHDFALA